MLSITRDRLAHSRLGRRRAARVFSKFAVGSVVATVCSQVTFLLLFGVVGTSALVAGLLGFVAGAVPAFLLNRNWAWRRSGPVGLRTELVPYVTVITANGLAATGLTVGGDHLVHSVVDDHALRTVLVSACFAASYGVLFVVKFVLLDRLVFGRGDRRSRHQVPSITRA